MPPKTINQNRGPLHKHDCDNCTYIDTVGDQDLYICDNTNGQMLSANTATAIVRFSPDGPDYASHAIADLRNFYYITLPYKALMLYAWCRYQQYNGVDLDTINNPTRFFARTFKKEA